MGKRPQRRQQGYEDRDNSEIRVKETNRKLRSQVRKLVKENKRLKSENKSLFKAWNKTKQYLEEKFRDNTLEEILKQQREDEDCGIFDDEGGFAEESDGHDIDTQENDPWAEEKGYTAEHVGPTVETMETCPKCERTYDHVIKLPASFNILVCTDCNHRKMVQKV